MVGKPTKSGASKPRVTEKALKSYLVNDIFHLEEANWEPWEHGDRPLTKNMLLNSLVYGGKSQTSDGRTYYEFYSNITNDWNWVIVASDGKILGSHDFDGGEAPRRPYKKFPVV
jgi:hypothetical protein